MTPALPALDALLNGVDAAVATGHVEYFEALADAAPRLAAMLRVAVEALGGVSVDLDPHYPPLERTARKRVDSALARIEAMAKGEA